MQNRQAWCDDLRDLWKWMLFIQDIHSPSILAIDVFSEKALKIGNGVDRMAIVRRIPHELLEDNDLDGIHKLLGDCSYCERHKSKFSKSCMES